VKHSPEEEFEFLWRRLVPQPGPRNFAIRSCREKIAIEPVITVPDRVNPVEISFPRITVGH
jgi:hypothetical protein